jgi:Asp-tRNA(Asn)/Glu-tRNA(Gln) amidotransferase A subunit family amidase
VGDVPFNWQPSRPLSEMRIGYLKTEFDQQTDTERKAIYQQAIDALKTAGANLQPIELPKFSIGALRIVLVAEAATAFDDITRSGAINQLSGQDPSDWPNTFRSSRFIPAVEYIRAQRARRLLMQQMDELMSKWDVFVSPAPGSLGLLITNLTGHPAVCVPCGFPKGLPQSIMFTGGSTMKARRCEWRWRLRRPRNGTRCIRKWIGRSRPESRKEDLTYEMEGDR